MAIKTKVKYERKEPVPKLKATAPGIVRMDIGQAQPSRPQNPERMGTGGRKARIRHKGRVDPKAADPHDLASTPLASAKVHWPTNDKNAQKGYVKGKAWPAGRSNCGPNPYAERAAGGGPVGGYSDDGANTQDMEGSYTESGQDT